MAINGSQNAKKQQFFALLPIWGVLGSILGSYSMKKNFFLIKWSQILYFGQKRVTKWPKRRGFTYNCGFLHLLTPETASKRPHRINFSSPNEFYMSKFRFKAIRSIFGAFGHGFFSPPFLT